MRKATHAAVNTRGVCTSNDTSTKVYQVKAGLGGKVGAHVLQVAQWQRRERGTRGHGGDSQGGATIGDPQDGLENKNGGRGQKVTQ